MSEALTPHFHLERYFLLTVLVQDLNVLKEFFVLIRHKKNWCFIFLFWPVLVIISRWAKRPDEDSSHQLEKQVEDILQTPSWPGHELSVRKLNS